MGSFYGGGGNQSGEIGSAAEERLNLHLGNDQVHTSDEEREKWNGKSRVQLNLNAQSLVIINEEE